MSQSKADPNRIDFTVRKLESLKPPVSGRVEYWDRSTPGFGLRISESGRRTWIAMYRHQGRLRRLTIGTFPPIGLADAREQAEEALRAARKGADKAAEKREALKAETFGELAEAYIDKYAKATNPKTGRIRKRSWREDRRALDRDLLPAFKHRKAGDIRRREIIDLLEKIRARGAPVLANRTLEIVRRMFNWAIEREVVAVNPCARIEKPSDEEERSRVLSDDEIKAVWLALNEEPPLTRHRFRLAILTGQRPGELRQMRWPDVDEKAGWWTIPREHSKTDLPHRVPLTKMALAELQLIERADPVWVFPSPTKDGPVRKNAKPVESLRKRSKVAFNAHDIRRTVRTRLAELGVAEHVAERVLGHIEQSRVKRAYNHFAYDAEKRAALDAWARLLEAITTGAKRPSNVIVLPRTA